MTARLQAADEAAALELLHELGCTDGLPVVIPTPERVERMVLASGLDGDLVLAAMGPAGGAATVEAVATAAVMAGCLPDHLPVVLAAVSAVCEPEFDLGEVQMTTHGLGPLVVVNGPARFDCGPIASSYGALGPGHRANASIGRALRLGLINIGGARPGSSDMALLGTPAKFTACLAEDEEGSPFEPLSVSRGVAPTSSAVTVAAVEAPHSVLFVADADDPGAADRLLRVLAGALAGLGTNNSHFGRGAAVVVLNPDHAGVLARAGYDRPGIAEALAERAGHPRSLLRATNPAFSGGPGDGELLAHLRQPGGDDDLVRAFSPEDLLIVHAGGAGLYSAVAPSWGGGAHGNRPVTRAFETTVACAVPTR